MHLLKMEEWKLFASTTIANISFGEFLAISQKFGPVAISCYTVVMLYVYKSQMHVHTYTYACVVSVHMYTPSEFSATSGHMEVPLAEVFVPLSKNQVNTYYHMII